VTIVEADFLCTKMAEKINNKMEHRMIKEQHLVLLASIEVDPSPVCLRIDELCLINVVLLEVG